jgi:hypothetical protein
MRPSESSRIAQSGRASSLWKKATLSIWSRRRGPTTGSMRFVFDDRNDIRRRTLRPVAAVVEGTEVARIAEDLLARGDAASEIFGQWWHFTLLNDLERFSDSLLLEVRYPGPPDGTPSQDIFVGGGRGTIPNDRRQVIEHLITGAVEQFQMLLTQSRLMRC